VHSLLVDGGTEGVRRSKRDVVEIREKGRKVWLVGILRLQQVERSSGCTGGQRGCMDEILSL
jgi:hypothetical protein